MITATTTKKLSIRLGRNGELPKEADEVFRAGLKALGYDVPETTPLKITPDSGWDDCGFQIEAEWKA